MINHPDEPANPFAQNMQRMRGTTLLMLVGTGAGNLIYGGDMQSHHYIDCSSLPHAALERFQKDFAAVDKQRREEERLRK